MFCSFKDYCAQIYVLRGEEKSEFDNMVRKRGF